MGRLAGSLIVLAALAGCAHSSVTTAVKPRERLAGIPNARVVVMQTIGAKRTIIESGRPIQRVQGFPPSAGRTITDRVLETVRQRHPEAELVDTPFIGQAITTALDRGATHMIVPEVKEWRDAETQYTGQRDRVEIELRLVQLRPYTTIASVTFRKNNGFLAVRDESPTRLIDNSFRNAVQQLLGER
jgi:hypothetical protein